MKVLSVAIFISMLSTIASANSVFKKDSKVPSTLQDKIVTEVTKNCPKIASYSLQEVSSVERVDKIDQGVIDYYYSTTLTGSYYFDGQHPILVYIDVDSLISSGYNPNGSEEVRLITNHDGACY